MPSSPAPSSNGTLFVERNEEAEHYRQQVDQILKEHQKRLQALESKAQNIPFSLSMALDASQVATQEVYILRCLLNQSLRSASPQRASEKSRALFLKTLLNEMALKQGAKAPLSCVRDALMEKTVR